MDKIKNKNNCGVLQIDYPKTTVDNWILLWDRQSNGYYEYLLNSTKLQRWRSNLLL